MRPCTTPPGPQPPSKRGPKPKKGQRRRRLTEWASDRETPWERIEVGWYGGERKVMQVFSGTGLWYTRGQDPVAIRYVLARDLEGRLSDAAYFCTDERFGPEEILKYVVQRWSMEVTFEEAQCTLGAGDAAAMVGLGDRADDTGADGPVLGRDAAGRAVASVRVAGRRADGVVREGVPDVLRLYASGASANLAESNYGAIK